MTGSWLNKVSAAMIVLAASAALGSALSKPGPAADPGEPPAVSPVRGISPAHERTVPNEPAVDWLPWRSIDGSGNNLDDPLMGAAITPLLRRVDSDYGDGVSELAGWDRPGAREISNVVSAQQVSIPIRGKISDFFWQWGQFLDHDIDLTDGTDPPELENILIPDGDPDFGPGELTFNRSIYDPASGTDQGNPRQQLNEITAWIDASNIYGSDAARAAALRTNDGTGRLRTSAGNFLPYNTDGLPNAGGPSDSLFLAGDVRANEQVGLTAMHTLFVREHNRLADIFATADPTLTGDEIYEKARRIVGAQIQAITYNEFLPLLLGYGVIGNYKGYDPNVDARIANVFSTAAYRFGHSMLSPTLLRLDADLNEISEGHLPLRQAFFAPQRITDEGGIEPILRGLASQIAQGIDPFVVDDVRNFLFGEPGSGGFDLVALNIQRGRDHGLPSYNDARVAFGLRPAQSFADVSSDPEIQDRLASIYNDVTQIDLWVGGLAEDRVPNALVGELFFTILKEQFEALRDGDRFWYERALTREEIREVRRSRLSDIIRRNTEIGYEIPRDVFHVYNPNIGPVRRGPRD